MSTDEFNVSFGKIENILLCSLLLAGELLAMMIFVELLGWFAEDETSFNSSHPTMCMPFIMEIVFLVVLSIIDAFAQPPLMKSITLGNLQNSDNVLYHSDQSDSTMAKQKFCSQNLFDSISSVNKHTIRLTVNRRVDQGPNNRHLIVFDEYRLLFDEQSNSFAYQYASFEFGHVQPRGGFYIHQLGIYIDFYRILSIDKNMFCCHQNSTVKSGFNCDDLRPTNSKCHAGVIDTNCYYISKECWTSQQSRIFPEEIHDHLTRLRLTAFVYEPKLEKIMYSFWNGSVPFMMSAIRIISSPLEQILWFTKRINSKNYRFCRGAFNWPSAFNYEKIYFLVQPDWQRDQQELVELLDSKSVAISTQPKSWKDFFGCTQHFGFFDTQLSRESVNYFPIYIVVILVVVILLSIAMALNLVKKCCCT